MESSSPRLLVTLLLILALAVFAGNVDAKRSRRPAIRPEHLNLFDNKEVAAANAPNATEKSGERKGKGMASILA